MPASPRFECRSASRGELRHLREAAGDGDTRHWMRPEIFQHPANEVAHVDERDIRQIVLMRNRRLGSRACCARDVCESSGTRDVDAAMDGVNPGRAGIRYDDPRSAEDRKAADHPKARVQRPLRDLLPAGNGDFDGDIRRPAK